MQLEEYFEFLSEDDVRIKGHRIGIDNVLWYYSDQSGAETTFLHRSFFVYTVIINFLSPNV